MDPYLLPKQLSADPTFLDNKLKSFYNGESREKIINDENNGENLQTANRIEALVSPKSQSRKVLGERMIEVLRKKVSAPELVISPKKKLSKKFATKEIQPNFTSKISKEEEEEEDEDVFLIEQRTHLKQKAATVLETSTTKKISPLNDLENKIKEYEEYKREYERKKMNEATAIRTANVNDSSEEDIYSQEYTWTQADVSKILQEVQSSFFHQAGALESILPPTEAVELVVSGDIDYTEQLSSFVPDPSSPGFDSELLMRRRMRATVQQEPIILYDDSYFSEVVDENIEKNMLKSCSSPDFFTPSDESFLIESHLSHPAGGSFIHSIGDPVIETQDDMEIYHEKRMETLRSEIQSELSFKGDLSASQVDLAQIDLTFDCTCVSAVSPTRVATASDFCCEETLTAMVKNNSGENFVEERSNSDSVQPAKKNCTIS